MRLLPVHGPECVDPREQIVGISCERSGGYSAFNARMNWRISVAFQIDDDRAVPMPPAPRPIVDAEHAQRFARYRGLDAQEVEQGIGTECHVQHAEETGPGLTVKGESNRVNHRRRAVCLPTTWAVNEFSNTSV